MDVFLLPTIDKIAVCQIFKERMGGLRSAYLCNTCTRDLFRVVAGGLSGFLNQAYPQVRDRSIYGDDAPTCVAASDSNSFRHFAASSGLPQAS